MLSIFAFILKFMFRVIKANGIMEILLIRKQNERTLKIFIISLELKNVAIHGDIRNINKNIKTFKIIFTICPVEIWIGNNTLRWMIAGPIPIWVNFLPKSTTRIAIPTLPNSFGDNNLAKTDKTIIFEIKVTAVPAEDQSNDRYTWFLRFKIFFKCKI